MYSKQEAFDTAMEKLLAQGCVSADEDGQCLYRNPNGNKCAIGHLIPDEFYDPLFEGRPAFNVVEALEINGYKMFYIDRPDYVFANSMQRYLHDDLRNELNFIEALRIESKKFATTWGLEYKYE